jgi:hypothetical protein
VAMNRLKSIVPAAVFFFLGTAAAWVDEPQPTVTLSVGEIARQVQSRNLDIVKAARDVERARQDLVGKPELMDSSLSFGGGYGSSGAGAAGWYGHSSLTLRIVPQLSAGASVVVEEPGVFGESVSLTVKPLEPSRQTYSEERALSGALVRERYLKDQIYRDAEQAALNLLISDMERELARATEDLQQKRYELVRRQQDIGEASFQDVQDQLVNLIDAREDLFSKESGYLEDWRTLQLLFAPGEERIAVAPLPTAELERMVDQRRARVKPFDQAEPVTEDLENLRLELSELEVQLEATPAWRPDLSLSTSVDFPYAYPGSHGASVGLSFSPNQLKREERENLREDIEIKRMEIAAETSAAALQKTLELQNITLVEQALASARIQVERDRVSLQEAELLFQQGGRTSLELEQLRLNLRRTQILTFRSAMEVYKALGVYQMLFLGE